ncbi:MAG: ATP-binding cassette domain-containing protein [Kiritimatiellae bacterium]|nr:ATP-binding cassette domain-containing protein [Kiritimatiellia bacterium]
MKTLLEVCDVQRRFGGLIALSGVSFRIETGEIKGVIGPNGAGKTTLFNIVSGRLRPTRGSVWLEQRAIERLRPCAIARLGLARTFQNVSLFDHMTARENVMTGLHLHGRAGLLASAMRWPRQIREERDLRRRADEWLDFAGLEDAADTPVAALPFGRRRMVELARALAQAPRLLLLDEPASGLNNSESRELAGTIRRIRDLGVTILLVEHDMSLVMDVCDSLLVLNFGAPIAEGPRRRYARIPRCCRSISERSPVMLSVRNLRCGYGRLEVLKGISFHAAQGEIVALVGANGAGKTTLLRTLAGLLPPWDGEVYVQGRAIAREPAWRGIFNGMTLVPEGRMVFADMSVMDNLLVGGYRNPDRRTVIRELLARFPRLGERQHQPAGTLSGGEQQMLAIARALAGRPRLLLLDEPSMGLAPLIVREMFEMLRDLRRNDLTVLLVEQNAAAALHVADRAYVMETGAITLEGDAVCLRDHPEVRRAYLGQERIG